jgi:hypothetical protein
MIDETLYDLTCDVSDCFNANQTLADDPFAKQSGYQHLSALMVKKYGLTHSNVDEVVGYIEELVAQYIMEQSPKFQDNEEH